MEVKGLWILLLIAIGISFVVKVYVLDPKPKAASDYFKDETSKVKVDDGMKF